LIIIIIIILYVRVRLMTLDSSINYAVMKAKFTSAGRVHILHIYTKRSCVVFAVRHSSLGMHHPPAIPGALDRHLILLIGKRCH